MEMKLVALDSVESRFLPIQWRRKEGESKDGWGAEVGGGVGDLPQPVVTRIVKIKNPRMNRRVADGLNLKKEIGLERFHWTCGVLSHENSGKYSVLSTAYRYIISDIALAAAHRMDFLLTWNCKHINNHNIRSRIQRACEAVGLTCPDICTPAELMKL